MKQLPRYRSLQVQGSWFVADTWITYTGGPMKAMAAAIGNDAGAKRRALGRAHRMNEEHLQEILKRIHLELPEVAEYCNRIPCQVCGTGAACIIVVEELVRGKARDGSEDTMRQIHDRTAPCKKCGWIPYEAGGAWLDDDDNEL